MVRAMLTVLRECVLKIVMGEGSVLRIWLSRTFSVRQYYIVTFIIMMDLTIKWTHRKSETLVVILLF